MEKSYNITIQTPLGNENGKIIFIINNGTFEDNSLTSFADTKYGLLSIKGKEI